MKADGEKIVHVPVPENAVPGQTIKFTVKKSQLGDDFKDDDEDARVLAVLFKGGQHEPPHRVPLRRGCA